tara:strand:+ start:70 stop:249 length:180 start_codon:yes stop_codon:yes gene_type:complete
MNDVPIGTEMIIKKSSKMCILKEITQFPTTFTVELENGNIQHCLTHEVDIIGWPPNEDR